MVCERARTCVHDYVTYVKRGCLHLFACEFYLISVCIEMIKSSMWGFGFTRMCHSRSSCSSRGAGGGWGWGWGASA